MAWMDLKKAYDSVDHKGLNKIMAPDLHQFPSWLCRAIQNLCASWNTRISMATKQGNETSSTIRFNKGLPQGDKLCPCLFTLCLNPVAWQLKATEGYKLSKPIGTKVTHLLHVYDLKVFTLS